MVYYARKVKQNLRNFSAPLGAPAMGAVAQATEESPGGRECQWVKEKAGYRTPLSLRGQFANWPWQSASLLRHARNTAVSRRTDSHVASLNATAAYHDSLICRLVPLGGMTTLFCSALSFPHCSSLYKLPIGKRQFRASSPSFLPPQVLFNLITPRISRERRTPWNRFPTTRSSPRCSAPAGRPGC